MSSPLDIPAVDTYTAGQREQLVRWAAIERMPRRRFSRTPALVLTAQNGSPEQLRALLSARANGRNEPVASDARHLLAALDGDLISLGFVLVDSEPLLTLARTAAWRSAGVDLAEIATGDGWHVVAAAIDPNRRYEITVSTVDPPWHRHTDAMTYGRIWDFDAGASQTVLTRYAIETRSAVDALHFAVQRACDTGLLNRPHNEQMHRDIDRTRQLDRLRDPHRPPVLPYLDHNLGASEADRKPYVCAEPEWVPLQDRSIGGDTIERHALAEHAPNLLAEYDATGPGPAREQARAARASWDVPSALPELAARSPLGRNACTELAARVIDVCPAAHPDAPSTSAQTSVGHEPAPRRARTAVIRAAPTLAGSAPPAPRRGPGR